MVMMVVVMGVHFDRRLNLMLPLFEIVISHLSRLRNLTFQLFKVNFEINIFFLLQIGSRLSQIKVGFLQLPELLLEVVPVFNVIDLGN